MIVVMTMIMMKWWSILMEMMKWQIDDINEASNVGMAEVKHDIMMASIEAWQWYDSINQASNIQLIVIHW